MNWRRSIGAVLLMIGIAALPAGATMLAFDFDDDGDPATVVNHIQADAGDLVLAYLIVSDIPRDYDYLAGLEFGLDHTDGLELLGIGVEAPRAVMVNEGVADIGVGLPRGGYIPRDDPPVFAVRVVFRVLNGERQVVSLVPPVIHGQPATGFVFLVANDRFVQPAEVVDPGAIATHLRGVVNGPSTPDQDATWARLKELYR